MNESFVKYINSGPLDKEWGLCLTVAGYAQIPPSLVYPPRMHPSGYFFTWEKGRVLQEYQINYITEGSGIFETATEQFHVVPGSMLILRPGMWHRYKPDQNTGWTEHYIGFNGEFCSNLFHDGFFQAGKPVLYVGFQESLLKLFFEIIQLVKDEKTGHQQVAASTTILMLSKILSVVRNQEFAGKTIERTIRKACLYFRENLHANVNIETLAGELHVGYSYFRQMFRKYTGISPTQYHLSLRIQKAKDLLVSTDKSFKEIAIDLGFESYFYFSRIFKDKTGKSPMEFRKEHETK
ncbi:MAG TPA: AraC family transcriptional regulator [Prolixibacteraceae bacterium]|nr:AraC family transcriptional regulator [Prolixibacteraceae bacterium]